MTRPEVLSLEIRECCCHSRWQGLRLSSTSRKILSAWFSIMTLNKDNANIAALVLAHFTMQDERSLLPLSSGSFQMFLKCWKQTHQASNQRAHTRRILFAFAVAHAKTVEISLITSQLVQFKPPSRRRPIRSCRWQPESSVAQFPLLPLSKSRCPPNSHVDEEILRNPAQH